MSNYKNIKPYADFSHEAAKHGGVKEYLDQMAQANYNRGVLDERESEPLKMVIAGSIMVFLVEGGKWIYRTIKDRREKENIEISEKAKEAIMKRVKQAEFEKTTAAPESNRDDCCLIKCNSCGKVINFDEEKERFSELNLNGIKYEDVFFDNEILCCNCAFHELNDAESVDMEQYVENEPQGI